MIERKFNKQKVLIAPLDWGLGHATRCIPIIRAFRLMGWEVIIAADGPTEQLLRQEFTELKFLKLHGYNVEYSNRKWMLPVKLFLQVPKILMAIKREHRWLKKVIAKHHINLVVSDNRYGLYSDKIPCIFLTHQLLIKAPIAWVENKLQQINYKYISRFTECWVPDEVENALAGELSHPGSLHPFPIKYIGALSRFTRQPEPTRYKYCFLISGPEPQRTAFENIILEDASCLEDHILVVRGKPGSIENIKLPSNITIVNHLEGPALQSALNASEYIISRSGYTTVMEIACLQKPSILVPTPGQTEQEYLGEYLRKKGWAYSVPQHKFQLSQILLQAEHFMYTAFPHTQSNLPGVIQEFLSVYHESEMDDSFAASS